MTAPSGWVREITKRGVDPGELEQRREVQEQLFDAEDALGAAADELKVALNFGVEGQESSDREAAARAEFEQALAGFREAYLALHADAPGAFGMAVFAAVVTFVLVVGRAGG